MGGKIGGEEFEMLRLIGEGAFAKVYLVRNTKNGQVLACKVSTEKEMLYREGELLAQIKHPLFPRYYGVRQTQDAYALLMEYIPGSSLAALLARRGRLSERQSIRIAMQLADGLACLHELPEPVLYLDLKPENIIIRENGKAALVDFGCAGGVEQSENLLTGTPHYAAPEQLRHGGKAGTYSDVYALGKIMLHMCPNYHRGVRLLLDECVRERERERVPDIRYFQRKLLPYTSESIAERIWQEGRSFLHRRKAGEYLYEKNVVKNR